MRQGSGGYGTRGPVRTCRARSDGTGGRGSMQDRGRGSRRRAPGRHRGTGAVRHGHPLWLGVALLAVLGVGLPVWLCQARPFDVRHGIGVDAPPAGIEPAQAPVGKPPATPGGHGGYTFMKLQADGADPVAYDPCPPIHFTTSRSGPAPRGARPPGGGVLVREAVATMAKASGLRFVDDGPTDEVPVAERDPYQPDRYG